MPVSVRHMLDAKGRNVVSVSRDKTIAEVAAILHENKIGAVVITSLEERIAGIFTERDLVRSVAVNGASVLSQPVSSAMTTNVTRCHEDNSLNEVMEIMSSGRFRHIPVEEQGRLVGIISIGDVVKTRIHEVETEAEQIRAYIAS
ncbi:CBS domain-containing protein [Rhizobium sp. SSA_523]|uniref:CBS domain-containing protein n=1 Tax=Rhizobium sp. SSA_523 TaxID=2952477 RepID=UPI002090E44C|nr:CBS domain-containing protein [Rhizobium sp. SSA_523]MCO5733833.1 CBS domain-containing protein [Rhizobium sp. SSA_523]WKC24897.1 CBS domain-containing protein [Rhizobium sp. SSA_523]